MGEWRDLHQGWVLNAVGSGEGTGPDIPADVVAATVPASVPGCVHTDLLTAGLIPDPYLDQNEHELRWIGRTDWRYATTFDWQPDGGDRVDLVCNGLDTVARIELNDALVGTTQNMHRSYRFEVGQHLRPGANTLAVTFGSAQAYAENLRDQLGDLPGPNSATPEPFNFIRKMACNFGWDWGPILVTAGIWKPIRLHTWQSARLGEVRPQVTVESGVGKVRAVVEIDRADVNAPLTLTAEVAGVQGQVDVAPGETSATLDLDVVDPALWWPHGHGDQPLYDFDVALAADDGTALDSWSRRIGFRTVRLDTTPDEIGSAFTIVVNEVPIFARGANWIPDDCFPSRIGPERYRARLRQAKDAHIDLLRIWGGGIYEQEAFYDAADELGILVWQDFLFACAAYPEESPIAEEVEAEARENVARLMPHPSLVLWNGNNENIWGYFDWGWQARLDDRTWGKGYYLDVLARVVAETDPARPYWPGSPYSGSFDIHPNADDHGCKHIWDAWNQKDYAVYRDYVPRFLAEFGWQGPPTWATLTRAVHDEPLAPDSPGVLSHQKATDGNGKLARGLAPHFDDPATMDDWHWVTQLNQARALTYAIEHFRSHRGRCMGTVIWQLNDCWPVTSWAAVDGDARRKPLWYALRKVYDPRLLTVQPRDGGLDVIGVNDGAAPWDAEVVVERRAFGGEVFAQWTAGLEVGARDTAGLRIPADVATPVDVASELLVVTAGDRRTTWFFAEDKDLAYPEPQLDIEVTSNSGVAEVRVTARTLVRDLAVFADRLDPAASTDDMLVTLLPGETHTFGVDGLTRSLAPHEVAGAPVLRCAGDSAGGGTSRHLG
jgi:beta-mannosidase